MTTIINADNGVVSGSAGLKTSADSSGVLELQASTGVVTAASNTGALTLPTGTTAQRPSSPIAGMTRMNTTTGNPEWWSSVISSWVPFSDPATLNIDYIVVAGGGSGGGYGGGGGAGGCVTNLTSTVLSPGVTLTVVLGAGGAAQSNYNSQGNLGVNSSLNGAGISVTAIGGGGGGTASYSGISGGSGGGGGYNSAAGSATSGQGNSGGAGGNNSSPYPSGGGGGASSAGGAALITGSTNVSGNGGMGLDWKSLGTYYAGGGGGGVGYGAGYGTSGVAGTGGAGGGGNGQRGTVTGGTGTVNTGGGGGGGGYNGDTSSALSGAGGSGICIIRYLGTPRASGGTITQVGGYTYHTFTSSGNFTS